MCCGTGILIRVRGLTHIKFHPEYQSLGRSSFSVIIPKKWNAHWELKNKLPKTTLANKNRVKVLKFIQRINKKYAYRFWFWYWVEDQNFRLQGDSQQLNWSTASTLIQRSSNLFFPDLKSPVFSSRHYYKIFNFNVLKSKKKKK